MVLNHSAEQMTQRLRASAATREANAADLRTADGFPVATPVRANALAERRQPPMLNIAFDEAARS
jgi:hypothetical protein